MRNAQDYAVRVDNLVYRVDSKTILDSLNLEIRRGEVLSIMGGSGSGKTTLLKCIVGLLKPTSGAIWIGEQNMAVLSEAQRAPLRRTLGIVFQYAALFDYLTVEQNVIFGLERQRDIKRAEMRKIARERLDWVGLKDVENLYPSQLSGGMRKRVGLARALATDPEMVLFDEPTSGLDPITTHQIDSLITRLNRELNLTAVVVSHDVGSVLRVSDRIAMLAQGRFVETGSVTEILNSSNEHLRAFLEAARSTSVESAP